MPSGITVFRISVTIFNIKTWKQTSCQTCDSNTVYDVSVFVINSAYPCSKIINMYKLSNISQHYTKICVNMLLLTTF